MAALQLTAFEHDQISIGDQQSTNVFDWPEADELSAIGELRPGFCVRGHRSMRFGAYCGVVPMGPRALEVLPKVGMGTREEGRASVLRLLEMVGALPLTELGSVSHELEQFHLLEVFLRSFMEATRNVARFGLVRSYSTVSEDRNFVRGKIDLRRQLGPLANRPDLAACACDELRVDNANNCMLRAALDACRGWIGNADLWRQWLELSDAFSDVPAVWPSQRDLIVLQGDRRFVRYRRALAWASVIRSMRSPSLRAGSFAAPGLLFNMNQLFQEVVAQVACQKAAQQGVLHVSLQDSGRSFGGVEGISKGTGYSIKPDLVVRRKGRTVAIADAKWKLLRVDKLGYLEPELDDLYQMLAYTQEYRCEEVALIYPWHGGLSEAKHTVRALPAFGDWNPRVEIVCVDVGADPIAVRTGHAAVAELLRGVV